jgi:2-polyprenyl-3-methyl-5-hydroxy-6-metoxy-1,4-benzoquinol methylase
MKTHIPPIDRQVDYWKTWQREASESTWAKERSDLVYQWVRELPIEKPKILDLGCGTGWFTSRLAELGETTGLDLNEAAMNEARHRWPSATFIGGDLYHADLEHQAFDIIVSMQVIAHVPDQEGFVRRVCQLLKPGGYFLVTTNNRFVMRHLGTKGWGSHASRGHIEQWLTMRSLKHHLRILRTRTLRPMGDGGPLRILNSVKLNALVDTLLGSGASVRLRESLGLGYYLLVLAQDQPHSRESNSA